eukprot:TRINITY_DN3263_c0_g2_i1.p1 TRINITY_DN3263_c0_g2~~TRINITY_DN3263_c0_g2_i1.p1  ORF type:complete len:380 (+),score=159.33 TRINITY_DN3263_c0_g2_i1:22-1161(+)
MNRNSVRDPIILEEEASGSEYDENLARMCEIFAEMENFDLESMAEVLKQCNNNLAEAIELFQAMNLPDEEKEDDEVESESEEEELELKNVDELRENVGDGDRNGRKEGEVRNSLKKMEGGDGGREVDNGTYASNRVEKSEKVEGNVEKIKQFVSKESLNEKEERKEEKDSEEEVGESDMIDDEHCEISLDPNEIWDNETDEEEEKEEEKVGEKKNQKEEVKEEGKNSTVPPLESIIGKKRPLSPLQNFSQSQTPNKVAKSEGITVKCSAVCNEEQLKKVHELFKIFGGPEFEYQSDRIYINFIITEQMGYELRESSEKNKVEFKLTWKEGGPYSDFFASWTLNAPSPHQLIRGTLKEHGTIKKFTPFAIISKSFSWKAN